MSSFHFPLWGTLWRRFAKHMAASIQIFSTSNSQTLCSTLYSILYFELTWKHKIHENRFRIFFRVFSFWYMLGIKIFFFLTFCSKKEENNFIRFLKIHNDSDVNLEKHYKSILFIRGYVRIIWFYVNFMRIFRSLIQDHTFLRIKWKLCSLSSVTGC